MKFHYCLLAVFTFICSCTGNNQHDSSITADSNRYKDYIKAIPGKNDAIPQEIKQKGEVLIAYSDCYTCHTIETRSKGPAFMDIAKRYPVNDGYIELLANKIIVGGSGAWGYPVMAPHPDISLSNARLMAQYILSLKK